VLILRTSFYTKALCFAMIIRVVHLKALNQLVYFSVPYLNFPLQKQMTYGQKKSIYDTYSASLPEPNGRTLLSYASFLVGFMELNEEHRAKEYMKKQGSHFSEPFQVLAEFTNTVPSSQNNYHYLPGYASFIQSFISAYCGLRVRNFQLDFIYPSEFYPNYQSSSNNINSNILKRPLGQSEAWNITGIEYQGNKLDILYDVNGRSIIIRNRPHVGPRPAKVRVLEVVSYEGSQVVTTPLTVGQSVTLRLDTDAWVYSHKRYSLQRLHKSTGYADNINILASVYASDDYAFIDRPSAAARVGWSGLVGVIAAVIAYWACQLY